MGCAFGPGTTLSWLNCVGPARWPVEPTDLPGYAPRAAVTRDGRGCAPALLCRSEKAEVVLRRCQAAAAAVAPEKARVMHRHC
jgi:hypothetical protein